MNKFSNPVYMMKPTPSECKVKLDAFIRLNIVTHSQYTLKEKYNVTNIVLIQRTLTMIILCMNINKKRAEVCVVRIPMPQSNRTFNG